MRRDDFQKEFDRRRASFIEEWKSFLRFPSVSADPARDKDCRACAGWLVDHLHAIGMTARLMKTAGKPVVFGERKGDPAKPTVLLYGHYDVQPADPLDAWRNPPFDPRIRGGRMWARGAVDNKGQIFYALKAIETLIARRAALPTVKIVVEGEEECGSRGISAALPAWRDLLRADILMVTDTNMSPSGVPAIVMGLRGIVHLTAVLSGPSHDLHSGAHGGVAPNPALEMARLLASLHNPDGSVAVDGFYEGVEEPSRKERSLARRGAVTAAAYRKATGVPPQGGECRFTPAERAAFRPCLDANGVASGYSGAGSKTIIPARATAKLSARLVPRQDPAHCLDAIIAHLDKHKPRGLRLEITEKGIGGPAVRLNVDSPLSASARAVLDRVSGKRSVFMWEGASIPIIAALAGVSGAAPLLAGFGLEQDRLHAPNESFSLDRFRLGYLYAASFLSSLPPQDVLIRPVPGSQRESASR